MSTTTDPARRPAETANKLAGETSPYLLQHAENPVHWYPWGDEALEKARSEDKPILLSIGYSACHWCHVMAHESFEDPATAELMNRLFINIKVDREERPDLDKIYQTAHSMLTQRPGGWPLTVFLTPDEHMPIFVGTYFPNQPRHGMPPFSQVMEQIAEIYRSRRDDIAKQSDSLREVYQRIAEHDADSSGQLSAMPLDIARNQIEQQFDSRHGGYSGAPKFPHPAIVQRALRHWARTSLNNNPDQRILHTALFTLERMAEGGLFDHLGGGFCRYSTDEQWMIPHFEKMLYDNGPLLKLNTHAWMISADPLYLDAAVETADQILRDMQSPEGGYYSSLDADSEGVEGEFYVWTPDEIKQHIDADIYPVFAKRFGLDREANFEGHWHLHGYHSIKQLAEDTGEEAEAVRDRLRTARQKLFKVREQRVHPGRDDKILTSWNGLMIEGMAVAGRHLRKPEYLDSAERAAQFIKDQLWHNNRLLATHKDGRSHLNAYLDDYAFLLAGLLELLQSRWHSEWLNWACKLADVVIEQFEHEGRGGFYFTSHDHEQLIQRSKLYSDDATPSGNGVAAQALLSLGYLTANTHYLDAAERCLKAAWNSISQGAINHCSLLDALDDWLNPPRVVIVRGNGETIYDWQQSLTDHYAPSTRVYAIPEDAELPDSLKDKKPQGEVCAYVCTGTQCSAPVTALNNLKL